MASADNLTTITVEAGSAVTIFRFVSVASDGQFDHTGANARMDGVAVDGAGTAAGKTFAMAIMNGAKGKVEAGAAVTRGALVASDASGRAVAAGTSLNNYGGPVALEAASAAGEIIEVLLLAPDRHGGAS